MTKVYWEPTACQTLCWHLPSSVNVISYSHQGSREQAVKYSFLVGSEDVSICLLIGFNALSQNPVDGSVFCREITFKPVQWGQDVRWLDQIPIVRYMWTKKTGWAILILLISLNLQVLSPGSRPGHPDKALIRLSLALPAWRRAVPSSAWSAPSLHTLSFADALNPSSLHS